MRRTRRWWCPQMRGLPRLETHCLLWCSLGRRKARGEERGADLVVRNQKPRIQSCITLVMELALFLFRHSCMEGGQNRVSHAHTHTHRDHAHRGHWTLLKTDDGKHQGVLWRKGVVVVVVVEWWWWWWWSSSSSSHHIPPCAVLELDGASLITSRF